MKKVSLESYPSTYPVPGAQAQSLTRSSSDKTKFGSHDNPQSSLTSSDQRSYPRRDFFYVAAPSEPAVRFVTPKAAFDTQAVSFSCVYPFPPDEDGLLDVVVVDSDFSVSSIRITKAALILFYPPDRTANINSSEVVRAYLSEYPHLPVNGPRCIDVYSALQYISQWTNSVVSLPRTQNTPLPQFERQLGSVSVLLVETKNLSIVTSPGFRVDLPNNYRFDNIFSIFLSGNHAASNVGHRIVVVKNPRKWAVCILSDPTLSTITSDRAETPKLSRIPIRDAVALVALGQTLGPEISHLAISQILKQDSDGYLTQIPVIVPQEFVVEGGPISRSISACVSEHPQGQPTSLSVLEYIRRNNRIELTEKELAMVVGEMPGFRLFRGKVEVFLY
jgi:hypothetical protein